MNTIYLDYKDVPQRLKDKFPQTRSFRVTPTLVHTINAQDGAWSGGSRTLHTAARLQDWATVPISDTFSAPWNPNRTFQTIELKSGFCILQHGHFLGKDAGVHIFCHPDNVAPLLPPPGPALDSLDLAVLHVIKTTTSSYRKDEYERRGLTLPEVQAAKERLTTNGYLAKNGGITPKGRNACPNN